MVRPSHPGIAGPSSGLAPLEDIGDDEDDEDDDAFSPGRKAPSSKGKGKTKAKSKLDEKGKNKRASSEEEFDENKPKKVPRQKIEVACDYCRGTMSRICLHLSGEILIRFWFYHRSKDAL